MAPADPAGSKPQWQRHDAVVEHMEKAAINKWASSKSLGQIFLSRLCNTPYVIKLFSSNEAESVYEIQELAEETYVCKVKEL